MVDLTPFRMHSLGTAALLPLAFSFMTAVAPISVAAQALGVASAAKSATAAKPAKYVPPRMPDGHPDLSGFWSSSTATPLQRPDSFAGREFLRPDEVEAVERGTRRNDDDRVKGAPCVAQVTNSNCAAAAGGPRGGPGGVGDYNAVFLEDSKKVVATLRTSIITDPKDGKVPPFTPEAKLKVDAAREYQKDHVYDGPENLSTMDRCLTGNQAGPPMLPAGYNNTYHIVQTGSHVAIASETIHDIRVVPLDGRAPSGVRRWLGETLGHWEGDTLVLETTNFNGRRNWFYTGDLGNTGLRADAKMRVTERFTRTAPEILLYHFTVDDPGIFTKPWSGEIPMTSSKFPIFEYACHEGNYSMPLILSGARTQEKAAAARSTR